jgi:putative aldouronate transport system substrate-binding protein
MSKRYFFLLVFSVALAVGTLFAGGRSSASSSAGTQGPMPITWVAYQLAPLAQHPKIIQLVNEKFNVDIQIWNIESGSFDEMLNLKFAANEIPDFFQANRNNIPKYYEQGVLAEIPEDSFRNQMPAIYREYNELYPDFFNLYNINGKVYGIPTMEDQPYRQPALYRGDWIKAVGKQNAPATLAELEELMYLFTNNDPDKNGRKDTYGLSSSAFNMVYGAYGYVRGQWNEKNGQLVYSSVQPEMKEALGVLSKWYKDGVIDPEFITGENKGGYWGLSHAFIEGRVGLTSHGNHYHWNPKDDGQNYKEMYKTNPSGADSILWGNPVMGPGGKKGLSMGHPVGGTVRCFGIQIEKQPEKMKKIFEIENWITSDADNYLTVYQGIKGEDWDYNADRVPTWKAGIDAAFMNSQGGHVVLPMPSPSLRKAVYPARPIFLEANNFYQDGYRNELLANLPSAGLYQTELGKIEDETYIAIITGERPLSYFDQFVAQWKSQGGDALTKEANDWWNSIK